MEPLLPHLGQERTLHETTQAMHFAARKLSPGLVGALQVTCADEAELECIQVFQRGFVQFLLPALKTGMRAPFSISNLGGRYEWGAVRVAEEHYAMHPRHERHKLIVLKINAHVGCEPLGMADQSASDLNELKLRLGVRQRYDDSDSTCCGALNALISGGTTPFVDELGELFHSEGLDRLALLRDPKIVDPKLRPLYAAVVSARLQARKALLDIQDHETHSPTSFLVVAGVTLNRPGPDTEILCGAYLVDGTGGSRDAVYTGLGDDPSEYEMKIERERFQIRDEHLGTQRKGRDHREMAKQSFQKKRAEAAPLPTEAEPLRELQANVQSGQHRNAKVAKRLLRMSLPVLAEVAPIPAALFMFAEGAVGIHHVFRVHKLSEDMSSSQEARRILDDVHAQIDTMDPLEAEALVELLAREVRG